MRILVVQESDWIEVGPHQSHHLFERLSSEGHQVKVIDHEIRWKNNGNGIISPRRTFGNHSKIMSDSNIEIIRPSFMRVPILDYLSIIKSHRDEIEEQILEFSPDIIVGFGILNSYLSNRLASRFGIPFVYYLIDELPMLVPIKGLKGFAELILSRNLRSADQVLVINQALKRYAIDKGASHEAVKVLPAGIDVDFFSHGDGKEIRERYRIEKDVTLLFFMGWLYDFSGLREIVLKMEEIETPCHLLILGKGDLWDELQDIIERKGLDERVTMVSWRPYNEIPSFIEAADICILPSFKNRIMRNIVPIKIYEYMAGRNPVIATRLPGLMEEFGEDNGIVYIDSPEEVFDKVEWLENRGLIESYGEKAWEFVNGNSWRKITSEFSRILENQISG